MDPQIFEVLAAVVTIGGGIYAAVRWGKGTVVTVWRWITRYRPLVPRETVRILPQVHGCWWHKGSVAGKPAMKVAGQWFVTNITGDPVLLLGAKLVKPETDGHVMVRHPEQNIFGRYPILPGATTEVSADFWVMPLKKREGEDFIADVILVDQYGNPHRLKTVRFRGPSLPEPKKDELKKEPIHSISDPVEKQIVSVLKSEVARYADCGRRVGGLGSIQTTQDGRRYTGVGTEWREAESPKNQSIVTNPDQVLIESDNATALQTLYESLTTDEERARYVAALQRRLSKATEYAPVGYMILYAMHRIGHLSEALEKAKRDLQGDPAYGFSDLLRFLDALLRFKHPEFDNQSLDDVERFIEGITEHPRRINERLAAIRAARLLK